MTQVSSKENNSVKQNPLTRFFAAVGAGVMALSNNIFGMIGGVFLLAVDSFVITTRALRPGSRISSSSLFFQPLHSSPGLYIAL